MNFREGTFVFYEVGARRLRLAAAKPQQVPPRRSSLLEAARRCSEENRFSNADCRTADALVQRRAPSFWRLRLQADSFVICTAQKFIGTPTSLMASLSFMEMGWCSVIEPKSAKAVFSFTMSRWAKELIPRTRESGAPTLGRDVHIGPGATLLPSRRGRGQQNNGRSSVD